MRPGPHGLSPAKTCAGSTRGTHASQELSQAMPAQSCSSLGTRGVATHARTTACASPQQRFSSAAAPRPRTGRCSGAVPCTHRRVAACARPPPVWRNMNSHIHCVLCTHTRSVTRIRTYRLAAGAPSSSVQLHLTRATAAQSAHIFRTTAGYHACSYVRVFVHCVSEHVCECACACIGVLVHSVHVRARLAHARD